MFFVAEAVLEWSQPGGKRGGLFGGRRGAVRMLQGASKIVIGTTIFIVILSRSHFAPNGPGATGAGLGPPLETGAEGLGCDHLSVVNFL